MDVVAYDPRQGCAIQDDLILLPLPPHVGIDWSSRVIGSTRSVRFEMTMHRYSRPRGCFHGHLEIATDRGMHVLHGAYSLRPDRSFDIDALDPTHEGSGTLFDDEAAYDALVAGGILTEPWHGIGMLLVERCALPLVQAGRAAILVPPGGYYVGCRRRAGYFHGRPGRDFWDER